MASTYSIPGSGSGAGPSNTQTSSSNQRAASVSPGDATRESRKKKAQPRQLLSCSKCRERKVRCDRTKPCSACCARGHPKECVFTLGEGTAFGPIQQSLELRKLRSENQKLKRKLQEAKVPIGDDSDEDADSGGPFAQATKSAQRRFGADDPVESLYFGSPGMLSVISEFAETQVDSRSLAHTIPRGINFGEGVTIYPFPTIWTSDTWVHGLYSCLRPWEEIVSYLDTYTSRLKDFAWPHLASEVTKKEVERFTTDFARNAENYPDMLALIFAALATGVQRGIHKRSGSQWVAGAVEQERLKGDVFVSACMQALRHSSYLSQPTLLSVQALIMLGPYLTNSGRLSDAWTLFGTTIRAAQSLGLHRDPRFLNPTPSLRESALRKKLWWWMLHMDQHYSLTLGRPLGISGIGDCPFVEPLTTEPAVLRTGECVNHLTVLGRQILSSAQLTSSRIDQLSDKLLSILDMLPDEMQFNDSWLADPSNIPESPLDEHAVVLYGKVHNCLILLNRQRIENSQTEPGEPSSMSLPTAQQPSLSLYNPINLASNFEAERNRGRPQVLLSSVMILSCFEFFYHHIPESLIDWTIGQQAFNAAMILLLDMQEQKSQIYLLKVDATLQIFRELSEKGIHKLTTMAVQHIELERTRLVSRLREAWEVQDQMNRSVMSSYSRRDSQMSLSMTPQMPQGTFASPSMPRTFGETDAVMGSTGMFLLDDQRTQRNDASFVQERRTSAPYSTQAMLAQSLPAEQLLQSVPQQQSLYQYPQHSQHPQQPMLYQSSPLHSHPNSPYMIGMQQQQHMGNPFTTSGGATSTHTSPTLQHGETSASQSRRSSQHRAQYQQYRAFPPGGPPWGPAE